jgi:hypothetical protein
MADAAAEARVGKATLFRAFGDRTGLIQAPYGSDRSRTPWNGGRHSWDGPPLRRSASPPFWTPFCDSRWTTGISPWLLEEAESGGPYQAEQYDWRHKNSQAALEEIPGLPDGAFTAHALLAATRADLGEHLAGQQQMPREQLRAHLVAFAAHFLDSDGEAGWGAGFEIQLH